MKLQATRHFVTFMTVLLSSTPLDTAAKIYPCIDLSSSDGESMVPNPSDELLNALGESDARCPVTPDIDSSAPNYRRIATAVTGALFPSNRAAA